MKCRSLSLNHPYYETLTHILECDSYRRVQSLLLGKDKFSIRDFPSPFNGQTYIKSGSGS